MDSSRGNAVLDRLHLALGELRLGEVDALLESHLQRAAQGDRPYADFLLDVLEAEMRARRAGDALPECLEACSPAVRQDAPAVRLLLSAQH